MRIILLVCAALFGLALKALAAEVSETDKYYEAQTIITGVLEPERTRGFREGLREILIKVANAPELEADGRLPPILEHASDFIASYTLEDRNKHLKFNDEQGTRDRPHYLRMQADRAKVDGVLASLGLKPWFNRPVFEVLLVVHGPRGAFLIGDELPPDQASKKAASVRVTGENVALVSKKWDGFEQRETLKSISRRRGYAIAFPDLPNLATGEASVNPSFPQVREGQAVARWQADLFPDASGFWRLDATGWRMTSAGEVERDPDCYAASRSGVTFDVSIRDSLDAFARLFKEGLAGKCASGPT